MKRWLAAFALLALAACSSAPKKPHAAGKPGASHHRPAGATPGIPDDCPPYTPAQEDPSTRGDYTPGGLYKPGVPDRRPDHVPRVECIPEPVVTDEPRSPVGNRSPYTVLGKVYHVLDRPDGYVEQGIASYYGTKFHGRRTSNQEVYDMYAFTAAHKTLPLPSYALVTNLDNGRRVVVRVNDRGPFHEGRIIDLSYAAAVRLGLDRTGTARVEVRALSPEGAAPLLAGGNTPATPATTPAAGDGGRRIVQVGAYSDKDNARRVARQLQDAGIRNVDVEDVRVDGRKFWRVRVGPLAAAAAEEVARTVVGLGLPSPRVFSE